MPPDEPLYAEVAVAVPVDRLFTYGLPAHLRAGAVPGRRIRVPFGPRSTDGYLVGTRTTLPEGVTTAQVKDVQSLLDDGPLLDRGILELGRFLSRWYGCSLGEALDAALPAAVKSGGKRKRIPVVHLKKSADETRAAALEFAEKNPKRSRILHALLENEGRIPSRELQRVAHCGDGPLRTLAKAGWLRFESVEQPADPFALLAPPKRAVPPPPTAEQDAALKEITATLEASAFRVFLLLGITGSGKTEVYLRALEETVRLGRQAIVMVPEIALTPQTVERFRARCPRVAVLHSALTDAERHEQWRRIKSGGADVVIGPRSAVFAPVPRLGLLVIDEEHESSFKQQNSPRYHARDVGIVRAREAGAAVILGSATPSLETFANARDGKYHLLRLPKRVGGGALPRVEIVDMLREREDVKRPSFLSRRLETLLVEAMARGEQGMLFLNRRGYATEVACKRCGHVMECPGCMLPYTFHRRIGLGLCHYCGGEARIPDDCPGCAAPDMRRRGFGTEKVEESLRAHFPRARIARMDSDTMKGRDAYEKVLSAFRARELDLLLGTQMIAKGLDFPDVTVVGVLNADVSLRIPDFRAAERTFQLVAQVAGRAGRAAKIGRVVVQTTMPDHDALLRAAQHDFEGFAAKELADRKTLRWPPWSRIARVVVLAKGEKAAESLALKAREAVEAGAPGAKVLGPAPTFLEQLKGKHRFHILVLAPDPRVLAAAVAAIRPLCRHTPNAEVSLDVDPMGTA